MTPTTGRLSILVLDAATGAPIPGVCLIVGTGTCGPGRPQTDVNGRWTTDVPLGSPTLVWDVLFIHPNYTKYSDRFSLVQGQTVTRVIRLQRAG
jgi:hypothetical protein